MTGNESVEGFNWDKLLLLLSKGVSTNWLVTGNAYFDQLTSDMDNQCCTRPSYVCKAEMMSSSVDPYPVLIFLSSLFISSTKCVMGEAITKVNEVRGSPFIPISGLLWGRYEDQMGSLVSLSGCDCTRPTNCHFPVIMIKGTKLDAPSSFLPNPLLPITHLPPPVLALSSAPSQQRFVCLTHTHTFYGYGIIMGTDVPSRPNLIID